MSCRDTAHKKEKSTKHTNMGDPNIFIEKRSPSLNSNNREAEIISIAFE